MFTQISNPRIVVYNGETNELIGTASFELTPSAEKAFLSLVNKGLQPSSLVLLDLDLYKPGKSYIPPTPYDAYKRNGTIYASFKDYYSGKNIPVEIKLKYRIRARGNLLRNLYHFDSADFSDIKIESVKINY